MQLQHAIKNGALILANEAVVPVTSRAVQYGFSTYESLRVIGGRPIHLSDHLERLENSCKGIGLVHPFTKEEITGWVEELIEADAIDDATLRIQLYGGENPILFVLASTILSYPDSFYTEGVGAISYEGERLIPSCKTGNLLLNYMALEEAKAKGCFEALLIDRHGYLLEGTRSNFFAFSEGVLHTAPDDLVLLGITRDAVIRAAGQLGIEVVYQPIALGDVLGGRYDELFISATSMAAMPLRRLDERLFTAKFDRTRAIKELVRRWENGG